MKVFFQPQKKFVVGKKGQMETPDMVEGYSINDVITEKRRLWKVWKFVAVRKIMPKPRKLKACCIYCHKKGLG